MTDTVPTQVEIADHLFCTARRVRQLIEENVIPAGATLDEARRCYIESLRGKARVRTTKGSPLEGSRNEALRLDIDRKRLELAELQGQLVRIPICEDYWRAICLNIKAKLLTAPNRCAGLVSPDIAPVVQAAVKGIVFEVLGELARDAVPKDIRQRSEKRARRSTTRDRKSRAAAA